VLLAFETDDPSYLPEFDMPANFRAALSRTRRGRQSVLALDILRHTLGGQSALVGDSIAELAELYSGMKDRSHQDTIVAALVSGQLAAANHAQASALLGDYTATFRRELRPLPTHLHRLATRIGGRA
jgi:hypothetical protein